jgi:hypothetical protein
MWRIILFIAACTLIAPLLASDDEYPPPVQEWSGKSPDGKYLAETHVIPDKSLPAQEDLDTGVLAVAKIKNGVVGKFSRHPFWRLSAEAAWSPDSQFIVMTTDSAGGHSPWHFESFVYSVKDDTLRRVDPVDGSLLIVRPTFTFVGPHQVRMAAPSPSKDSVDFEHPLWIVIDLAKKFSSLPKVGDDADGSPSN